MFFTVLALIFLASSLCSLLLKVPPLLEEVRKNLPSAACLSFSLLSAGFSCLKSTGSGNPWEWLLMLGDLLHARPTHAGVVAALPFLILGLAGLVVVVASWLVITPEPNGSLDFALELRRSIAAGPLLYAIVLRGTSRGDAAADLAWETVAEDVNRRLCTAALARLGE